MFKPNTSDSPLPSVPACFFMMRDIDRSISGYNICRALESIAGDGNIVGAGWLEVLLEFTLKQPKLEIY